MVPYIINKFPAFYEIRWFITILKIAHHLLITHLSLRSFKLSFASGSHKKIACISLIRHCDTCIAHLILLHLNNLKYLVRIIFYTHLNQLH